MKTKKKILTLAMALLTSSMIVGCEFTPSDDPNNNNNNNEPGEVVKKDYKKGEVDQKGASINPKSIVGYVGDVMPFYEDGVMNVFYLQDERNTWLGFHPFALMTSSDFINYHDYGTVIPYVNDKTSQDLALGTGTIIKGNDGKYHAFYTGHNSRKDSGLQNYEKIQHATSTDKINWTKHPEDGFYGGHNDFRDPYVYYSAEDNYYYMLVTTRQNDVGIIRQYRSRNFKYWTDCGAFYRNPNQTYNMECPTFLEYNGYYYLTFSEQGTHRVTHYRYKKNLSDEWIIPEVDYFDGEGLYAARLEKGFDKLLIYGWCGTKDSHKDSSNFNWAGNLVTHELVQQENGELRVKMVDEIDKAFDNEVKYTMASGDEITNLEFNKSKNSAYRVESLSDNVTKIEFKINASSLSGKVGLTFNTSVIDRLSDLVISFNLSENTLTYHNKAKSFNDFGNAQIVVPYKFEANKDINVKAIIDGEIITVYLDETICLTTRIYQMPNKCFSFFGAATDTALKEIKFYE